MVQQTSLSAYEEIKPKLAKRQAEVMWLLYRSKAPLTNKEIAEILDRPINTITPRTNELVKKGLIEIRGIKVVDRRRSLAWGVADKQEKGLS